jgi:glycosyltransferase involved in cell wall biosynthesis
LQRVHPTRRNFRALLPLYPAAIESFDLSGYDLVVSSSSAWAHAVVCDPGAVHVCYCHNPFRYAWNERHSTLADRGDPVTRAVARALFRRWRAWDWIAAQRVDRYVTNSRITQARIEAYFGRQSTIVYPPVDVGRFRPEPPGRHYLMVSEVISHKQIDVAVRAFAELEAPLVVVGDGPELRALRKLATPNVRFTGRVGDAEVDHLMATCRAFVVTAREEFGIAAVEAQAAGRPVIARRHGGVLETVAEGVTGCFWEGGSAELAEAVRSFDAGSVDPQACVANAARFGTDVFRRELPRQVAIALERSPGDRDEERREWRGARRRAAAVRRGRTPHPR